MIMKPFTKSFTMTANATVNGANFSGEFASRVTFEQFVTQFKGTVYAGRENEDELLKQAWEFFQPAKPEVEKKVQRADKK